MAVIKHAERDRLARHAVVLDLGDLRRAAEALEAEAKAKARSIVEEAEAERRRLIDGAAEEGRRAGHAEGLAAGLAEGRAQGREEALARHAEEFRRLAESWSLALAEFERRREDLLLDARGQVIALAVAIAERITRRVIRLDATVVQDQLRAALGLAVNPSRLVVRSHPDDAALLREVMSGLADRLGGGEHASFETDESLSRGSVVLAMDHGEVDASIETQLNRIVEALLPGEGKAA